MKARTTFAWRALGMAMLALLVTIAVGAGIQHVPREAPPFPEGSILHEAEGLLSDPDLIWASPAAHHLYRDPATGTDYTMIRFGPNNRTYRAETYDGYELTSIILQEDSSTTQYDTAGNIIGQASFESPSLDAIRSPSHSLYSYRYGVALTPYWLARLTQA